jgi:putative flippase GtrA
MHLLQILSDLPVDDSTHEITKTLSKFGWRILIDLFSVFVLVRFVYFPIYKHRELFFTFFIFNIIIFLICFLLNKVELSMGAAFGLFAVFSMLRYRTEDISIKDMTYLFLVIAIGLIAAVTKIKDTSDMYEYLFLGIINAIIITTTYLLESNVLMKKEHAKVITYENIMLINAEREDELKEDIKQRTGLTVHRLSIQKIDFLRDAAQIKIYYYEN